MDRPGRTSVAWIQQLSTDPAHLVNRVYELEELAFLLQDYLDNGIRDGRVLVTAGAWASPS